MDQLLQQLVWEPNVFQWNSSHGKTRVACSGNRCQLLQLMTKIVSDFRNCRFCIDLQKRMNPTPIGVNNLSALLTPSAAATS